MCTAALCPWHRSDRKGGWLRLQTSVLRSVLDSIVDALEKMGIEVVHFQAGSAPGQFKLATAHREAMQARHGPLCL